MIKSLSPKVTIQRIRIKFSRDNRLKYISHLDLMRLWERALRRAGIPVAYSEGFNPRPRISFASPLAVGTTSESELMDIYLEQRISPNQLMANASRQLPAGTAICEVYEVGLKVPSLQSQANKAEYEIKIETAKSAQEIESEIDRFLKSDHMQWRHIRDTKIREYDIRALVEDIKVLGREGDNCTLWMKLKISARPEQVALALGFDSHPVSIHRINIILNQTTDSV